MPYDKTLEALYKKISEEMGSRIVNGKIYGKTLEELFKESLEERGKTIVNGEIVRLVPYDPTPDENGMVRIRLY